MSFMTIDHPHIRRLHTCPLCTEPKPFGCVWCWPCHHRTQNAEDQAVRDNAEAILDTLEQSLSLTVDNGFAENVDNHRPWG